MHNFTEAAQINQAIKTMPTAQGFEIAGLPNFIIPPTHAFIGQQIRLPADQGVLRQLSNTALQEQAISEVNLSISLMKDFNFASSSDFAKDIYRLNKSLKQTQFAHVIKLNRQFLDNILMSLFGDGLSSLPHLTKSDRSHLRKQREFLLQINSSEELTYISNDPENIRYYELEKLTHSDNPNTRQLGAIAYALLSYLQMYSDGLSALHIAEMNFSDILDTEPFNAIEQEITNLNLETDSTIGNVVNFFEILERCEDAKEAYLSHIIEMFGESEEEYENIIAMIQGGEKVDKSVISSFESAIYEIYDQLVLEAYFLNLSELIKPFMDNPVPSMKHALEQLPVSPLQQLLLGIVSNIDTANLIDYETMSEVFTSSEDEYTIVGCGFITNPIHENSPVFSSFCRQFDDAMNGFINNGELYEEYTLNHTHPSFFDAFKQRVTFLSFQELICKYVDEFKP